jgi:signal transduction histidine kinase/CheY-like chemotaxis protein/HPt (histidine-containing phosphotransfer) domain-containing protein
VGEALGKSFMSFVHPDDIAPLTAYLDAVLDMEHRETSPTYRVKHADGGWRWIEANGTRYKDANGELRFIGIGRNITDRRADEEQLRDYAAALEANNKALEEFSRLTQEATRAKSVFLANMSHEIRTPMTAILGCADLLINEAEIESAPPERRINLDTIKRNGEHLLGLINDILDLSKIEAGKMKIDVTRCSPFRVIEEVLSLMRVRCAAKKLELKADLSVPLPETILTDPLRLRQMLINLIGNAIKFTDHGEICVAARLAEDGKLLRIDVSDTGIGMNEEQVGMLFKAFVQVDNSATRKFSGTGLGLCISSRLAEAMGGRIEVHSEPGKGSTFSIFIDPGPLNDIRMIRNDELPKKEVTMAFPAANQIDLSHCKVLLAEDGPDNQRLICIVLKNVGAEVTAVENGQLAVENALAAQETGSPYNVILMDMQMPVMDGYSATRELRRRGYAAPIIALTAHALSDDRKKCLDAGCDDFATKPINWVELLQMTSKWAKKAAAGESARKQIPQESSNMQEPILRSTYADVPVLAGILPDFVGGLDARVNAMKDALATENMEDLRRFAHQLKGAGGSYGYPSMSEAALLLETAVREGRVQDAESLLNKVVEVCQAAVRGFQEHQESSTP